MNNTRRKAIKQTIDRFDSIRKKLDEIVAEVNIVEEGGVLEGSESLQ